MWCSWGHCNQLPLKALGEDVTLTPFVKNQKQNSQHFSWSEGGHVLRISVLQSNCGTIRAILETRERPVCIVIKVST